MNFNQLPILKIFNYIGCALIFFGIAFFISINWAALNDSVKIFSTFGAAVTAYFVGMLLHLAKKEAVSSAFFMLSALVLPIGLYVVLDLYGQSADALKINVIVSAICLAVFLSSHLFLPRTIFVLFVVIFGSFFFIDFIDFTLDRGNILLRNVSEYEFLILGVSYILLGYYIALDKIYPLSGPLYFFGSIFILSSSYSLGGLYCQTSGISMWQIITALLIFCAFMLSVPLKSKSFLYVGAIFLTGYLIDMSTRFSQIFGHYGWPLMLVFAGFILMLIGYLIYYIHHKIN